MDRFESLTNTLSSITLYDIKSMYTQAKNVVLNVSEMEAKVREATNEDPWGASSTLMQEIAQGTFHFQHFNEIMPNIYSRFMEKEAKQWRQIYKALQLLEYLIKHGSERVVDDARSHISTLKMLRNFHYVDEKGKDEGVNVRNRARELVELLSDVEKIRGERRKAKTNKSKYVGVGNDGMGFGSTSFESGGRYGDSLSSSYNSSYINGGNSSRVGGTSFSDNRRPYEEYNAGDDEIPHASTRSNSVRNPTRKSSTSATPPAATTQPEVDLLGGFEDDGPAAPPTRVAAQTPALSTNKALPTVGQSVSLDDDDFADFQAAPVGTNPVAAPATQLKKPNLMDMLATAAVPAPVNTSFAISQQAQPMAYGMNVSPPTIGIGMGGHRQTPSLSGPLQFTPVNPQTQASQSLFGVSAPTLRPTSMAMGSTFSTPTVPVTSGVDKRSTTPVKGASNFDDLWNLSLGSTAAKPAAGASTGKSIKDLEREKATAGLWGGAIQQHKVGGAGIVSQPPAFSSFGNAPPPSSAGGGDDLLL